MTDETYMRRALELAEKGAGWVSPNPLVGAVIVKDEEIIGEGYHERYGQLHAERNALAHCTKSPEGATIYVTLEPCCHHGKQPPCTDALLAAGIRRVVIGSKDPNPLVHGKGIRILREHGVEVTEHVLEKECDAENEVFFHYMQTKLPFVILKYAMTLDGKIATYTGESRWVTGEAARAHVHRMRNRYRAIMVGVGTVLADDPMLNVRVEGLKSPVRIICDSKLRIPLDSQIVKSAREYRTIVAYADLENVEKKKEILQTMGVETVFCPDMKKHVNLKHLMEYLGKENIDSILLEGGGTLNDSALRAGVVQEVQAFIAPKIFGGTGSRTPVDGIGIELPSQAAVLKFKDICQIGEDLKITCQVLRKEQEELCLQEL